MWDYLCIQLSDYMPNSKKYLLCNLYRLLGGSVKEMNTFTDKYSYFLTTIKIRDRQLFCGDYNINLPQLIQIDVSVHILNVSHQNGSSL